MISIHDIGSRLVYKNFYISCTVGDRLFFFFFLRRRPPPIPPLFPTPPLSQSQFPPQCPRGLHPPLPPLKNPRPPPPPTADKDGIRVRQVVQYLRGMPGYNADIGRMKAAT